MRRYFSLEELSSNTKTEEIDVEEHEILSMEEQHETLTSVLELSYAIESEMNEINRISDVSDALEDLAEIASNIKEATTTDIELIRTVGQAAVAGTDIDSDSVVPMGPIVETDKAVATEAYIGKAIAIESIKEVAAKIWAPIARFLKAIWEKIKDFTFRISIFAKNQLKNVREQRNKIKNAQNLKYTLNGTDSDKIKISSTALKYLRVGSVIPTDLDVHIDKFSKVLDLFVNKHIANISSGSKRIYDSIKTYDITRSTEITNKLAKELAHWGIEGDITNKDLIGNLSIHDNNEKVSQKIAFVDTAWSNSGSYQLDLIGHRKIEIIQNNEIELNESEITPYSLNDLDKLLAGIETMLVNVIEFKDKGYKEANRCRLELESISEKSQDKFDEMQDVTKNPKVIGISTEHIWDAKKDYTRMLNLNKTYAYLAIFPAKDLTKHALSIVNNALSFVDKNFSKYKEPVAV